LISDFYYAYPAKKRPLHSRRA